MGISFASSSPSLVPKCLTISMSSENFLKYIELDILSPCLKRNSLDKASCSDTMGFLEAAPVYRESRMRTSSPITSRLDLI
eukprot:839685-Ditylum_brightwellii.AAC.1